MQLGVSIFTNQKSSVTSQIIAKRSRYFPVFLQNKTLLEGNVNCFVHPGRTSVRYQKIVFNDRIPLKTKNKIEGYK